MDHTGSVDEVLRGQAEAIVASHDQNLKEALLQNIVMPNLHLLKAGSQTKWNDAGWYTGLDGHSLAAMLARLGLPPEPFPVPADCGNWYPTEIDAVSQSPFRFFRRRAWLDLPLPERAGRIYFDVPFTVMEGAADRLRLFAAGRELALTRGGAAGAVRLQFSAQVDVDTLGIVHAAGFLRLLFDCDVVAVPALLYPGSMDRRYLSMAITLPTFA